MPERLRPRWAIEALFLIALAVAAAYADLASKWIVIVMAAGWLVVALLELSADRIWAAAPPWRRPYYVPASPPRAETAAAQLPPAAAEAKPEVQPEREPRLESTPKDEAVTMIAPRLPEPVAEGQPESEPKPEPELEPVTAETAPKPEPVVVDVAEIEMPEHVRLLPAGERTASDEVTELFDAPEREDRTRR